MLNPHLTEEDGDKLVLLDCPEEHVTVDVLDGVLIELVEKPSQNFILLERITYGEDVTMFRPECTSKSKQTSACNSSIEVLIALN